MKRVALALLVIFMNAASADELKDADQLLRSGATPAAAAILTRLADAGNPTAQVRLGELFFYGRGTAVDTARAQALFAQAAGAGNAEANAALRLMEQRQSHLADIAYWVGGYDGADLRAERLACGALALPVVSETKKQIRKLNEKAEAWRSCYNAVVANLNAQAPVGRQIPVEIELLMTDPEIDQARAHLTGVYTKLSSEANAMAADSMANYAEWIASTDAFVTISVVDAKRFMPEGNRTRDSYANLGWNARVALPAGNTKK
jgi:hypothetical protein